LDKHKVRYSIGQLTQVGFEAGERKKVALLF